MSIKEFTETYYPNRSEMERIAFDKFVKWHVDSKDYKVIRNALMRCGILNIRDLYEISDEQIRRIRNVGAKRAEKISELKNIIKQSVEN